MTIVTQIDAVKFQEALDAMCEDKDKQIAKLQQVIANQSMQLAHDAVTLESYENKFNQMQAQINELREALEVCKYDCHTGEVIGVAQQALAKIPAQSLQEHDNEVIEKCAKVCDEHGAIWVAKSIRALKGKQNESALERMAENARELGLVYCKHGSDSYCKECAMEEAK
jgi:Flp pilus assembly CpaE family ATPase